MDEPWQVYYEELVARAGNVRDQIWDRESDVRESAHDAYQVTVDRLATEYDYDDEDAIELAKSFGRAVNEWLEEGSFDLDELSDALEAEQEEWEEQFSSF
jgi:cupin superfamily acireductone dioxygenase involved in methionine salvage